ncbi:chromosome partitioning protein ParB [Vibrio parahaemolyticus]|uniref:chromosome partitioning protein ParB n=1 Tax=Vibrio parahaemolyticus TaxID=670 RepID=UPI00040E4752|nr:chromosome partitioning protein ParB [Vibrio parahaemolyticus]KIT40379.1 chromosome partitioning protein ParB [Vibrio parahaemolyticus 49]EGQ7814855.1 chromosome partitioning protein ParB [Vibrio parahaemolyticus]EGQ8733662.1 chromosome partitioning protein ParB [Vibrio parahaemolyticus]EGQ8885220.1 chromosome partitioning protein ParB [Vibrio parahaemolyticus]EGQ8917525.1 chromosome partitioning protein ParB [Vibrio parahaemolyticus]
MSTQRYVEINDNVKSTWSIERIWKLAESLPVEEISIDDIKGPNEVTWFSDEGPQPTCREIAKHCQRINNADVSYPVILTSDYRVFDGMHRIAKQIMLGEETIKVRRFRENPEADEVIELSVEQV